MKKESLISKTVAIITLSFIFFIHSQTTQAHSTLSSTPIPSQHSDWSQRATIYQVNIRQYSPSGQLNDVIFDLDRIKKLGFNTIQLMPLHPIGIRNRIGSLGSPYSISDYYEINPEFGSKQDLINLIEQAHQKEIHVIMDWVANHTSWDNVWTLSASDFYFHNEQGQFVPPIPEWTDVIKLDYSNSELEQAMIDVLQYWISQFHIDGFRYDASHMVPNSFWQKARAQLDNTNELLWIGESIDIGQLNCCFDSLYSFEYHTLTTELAQGKAKPYQLWAMLQKNEIPYLKSSKRFLHYTSNHDVNAWEGTDQELYGASFKSLTVLNYFLPGIPFVYNGEEIALSKRLKFFDKDQIPWISTTDNTEFFYQRLNHLKNTYAGFENVETSLLGATCAHPEPVLILTRISNNLTSIGVFNFSPKSQTILQNCFTKDLLNKHLIDAFTNELWIPKNLELEPWSYQLIIEAKSK